MSIKLAKRDSKVELALQRIEDILTETNMTIDFLGIIIINCDGVDYYLQDVEDEQPTLSLPRALDSERLVVKE